MSNFGEGFYLLIIMGLLFAGGVIIGSSVERFSLQNDAVERGYAEWVMPENGRGKTIYRWIEEEPPNALNK